MSQAVPKQRKLKRDAPPEVIVQEAVPVLSAPNEDHQMERLSALPLTPENIPNGMKPESRLMQEALEYQKMMTAEGQQSKEMIDRMLKIGTLAAGIGLGVLICSKGYKYMFPAVEKTVESIVEESAQ